MSDWVKAQVVEGGKFPKNSFVGILKDHYLIPNENLGGTLVLQFDFEGGQSYNMPTTNKDHTKGVGVDGVVDVYPLNAFIKSIESIEIATGLPTNDPNAKCVEVFWRFEDGEPVEFKTEPSIKGKALHNTAIPRQVGTEGVASSFPDWKISQIEGLNVPAPSAPKGRPPTKKPKEPAPASSGIDEKSLTALLIEPKKMGEIFDALGGMGKVKLGDLKETIAKLKNEGKVVQDGETYQVA